MEAERKRILEMLQEGRITVEQAGELLHALEGTSRTGGSSQQRRSTKDVRPRPLQEMDWGEFGRALADRVKRRVAEALGSAATGEDPQRVNYQTAKLSVATLSRMRDGTAYTNYGHLVIANDVPEDLLHQKISDLTNFGEVEGPEALVAVLESKCDVNLGSFGATDEVAEGGGVREATKVGQAVRGAARERRRQQQEEAVLTAYTMEQGVREIAVGCYAGDLEFTGTKSGTFRLVALKPAPRGGSLAAGWEKQFPWSADTNGARHTFTLGDPDDPDATSDMTFRFEIPVPLAVRASTRGGDVSAESLTGDLTLETAGGDVDASGIVGRVRIETDGGDIAVGGIEGPVTARTRGGDASISEVKGDLRVEASGGDISVSDVKGQAIARTGGGDASISEVEGDVEIETGGGDIAVAKTAGAVTAHSGGGDISVSEVGGPLTAETGGGDIAASKIDGAVSAATGGGDICLSDVTGDAKVVTSGGSSMLSNISGSVSAG